MTAVSRDQAQASVNNALTVLTAEKRQADQTGGSPRTDGQLAAVAAAGALLDRLAVVDAVAALLDVVHARLAEQPATRT
ncbi:hypothetical protein [Streptomyces gardneri]|uniref:hypothetical protein n=1 Tax=Streptomyces gardneri TaxID=66892 RepID=UPI0035E34B22